MVGGALTSLTVDAWMGSNVCWMRTAVVQLRTVRRRPRCGGVDPATVSIQGNARERIPVVLLLDTSTLRPSERNDALTALHSAMSVPTIVSHDLPDELIRNTTHYWALGAGTGVVRTRGTNMRLSRAPRDLRAQGDQVLAVSFQYSGSSLYSNDDGTEVQLRGGLHLEDCSRPREYAFTGACDNASFLFSRSDLGLPIGVITEAALHLATSPLYRMVQSHFSRLSDVAESIGEGEASTQLAAASIQLTRALVASVVPENRHARDALEDTRLTAVMTYVRQHLGDPGLSAPKIANASHISVRQLYKLWSAVGENLAPWILRERLDGARTELASPGSLLVTIEVVARHWGFADAGHFSRRFREAYGFTPREWRMSRTGFERRT